MNPADVEVALEDPTWIGPGASLTNQVSFLIRENRGLYIDMTSCGYQRKLPKRRRGKIERGWERSWSWSRRVDCGERGRNGKAIKGERKCWHSHIQANRPRRIHLFPLLSFNARSVLFTLCFHLPNCSYFRANPLHVLGAARSIISTRISDSISL